MKTFLFARKKLRIELCCCRRFKLPFDRIKIGNWPLRIFSTSRAWYLIIYFRSIFSYFKEILEAIVYFEAFHLFMSFFPFSIDYDRRVVRAASLRFLDEE